MRCSVRAGRPQKYVVIGRRPFPSCLVSKSSLSYHRKLTPRSWRRNFSLASIPAILVPPVVFGGLLISLWTYKCLMMIIFQNKIIYMPSVPPFSRSEKVSDYINQCKPVEWTEHALKAADGTKIKLLEGKIDVSKDEIPSRHVAVVYFQGNASSLPPRLPGLSSIIKSVQSDAENTRYTVVALSYRGFWKSSGSANQAGIELDAEAALMWVEKKFPNSKIVLWGQSIGAGVATIALSNLIRNGKGCDLGNRISGLILETPFTSLRAMLVALYPQKFLPYRYLTPFLQSTWDSEQAFEYIGKHLASRRASGVDSKVKVLMLQAENDEIVPTENSVALEKVCRRWVSHDENHVSNDVVASNVERKIVRGALHTEVMAKPEGRRWIVNFLKCIEVY